MKIGFEVLFLAHMNLNLVYLVISAFEFNTPLHIYGTEMPTLSLQMHSQLVTA